MKLMIISDIHGAYDDLEKVLAIYQEEKPDKLVILGDILYHGPRNDLPEGYAPKKIIPALNALSERILAVRGNCDAEVDQMVLDFPMRSDYLEMYIDGRRFFITHGHLYDEHNFPALSAGDVYLYGHFHVPVFTREKGYYKVNPSSIALPKEGEKSFVIYEKGTFVFYNLHHQPLATYTFAQFENDT